VSRTPPTVAERRDRLLRPRAASHWPVRRENHDVRESRSGGPIVEAKRRRPAHPRDPESRRTRSSLHEHAEVGESRGGHAQPVSARQSRRRYLGLRRSRTGSVGSTPPVPEPAHRCSATGPVRRQRMNFSRSRSPFRLCSINSPQDDQSSSNRAALLDLKVRAASAGSPPDRTVPHTPGTFGGRKDSERSAHRGRRVMPKRRGSGPDGKNPFVQRFPSGQQSGLRPL